MNLIHAVCCLDSKKEENQKNQKNILFDEEYDDHHPDFERHYDILSMLSPLCFDSSSDKTIHKKVKKGSDIKSVNSNKRKHGIFLLHFFLFLHSLSFLGLVDLDHNEKQEK